MNTPAKKATGKPREPNLMMEGGGEQDEERIDPDKPASEIIAQVLAQQHDLQRRLTHLEAQQGQVALYMPRVEIPLGRRELEKIISDDPTSWFEVLEDYKRGSTRMNKGKVFCVQNYPQVPEHVSAGLKVMGASAP